MGFNLGGNTVGKILDPAGLFDTGGMFGPADKSPSATEALLTKMAQQLFEQSQPLRNQMLGQFGDVMSGKFDPRTSPMFAPSFAMGKQGISDQYNLAKENILGSTPRGGGMTDALTKLELGKAQQESSLPAMLSSQITNDMMNKAYGSVFDGGDSQASIGGMGQAANLAMQNKMLSQQKQSSNMQGLGAILALLM